MLLNAMHLFYFRWVMRGQCRFVDLVVLSRRAKIWLCGVVFSLAFDQALKPIAYSQGEAA